jgi:glycerophosphoryl diester phosphodiesterase
LLALLVLLGCQPDGPEPRVEAHRMGAGYWPQNSRMAAMGSIASGVDAVEFDLVLTADGVPVLAHDPWIDAQMCTTVDGALIEKEILIQDLAWEELRAGWLCGGLSDPDFPQAELSAEPLMSFDALIGLLKAESPDIGVHIDLKWEPGSTPDPEVFAEEVLSRWFSADLPNESYVSANAPEVISAVEAYGRAHSRDVETSLVWPRFSAGESTLSVALKAERDILFGLTDYVALAEAAEADGLAIYYEAADLRQMKIARAEGLHLQLWTVNDRAALHTYASWPVDALITDYPGDYP